MKNTIRKIGMLSCILAGILLSCNVSQLPQKPNIILIMADDVGTEVLACYGGTS